MDQDRRTFAYAKHRGRVCCQSGKHLLTPSYFPCQKKKTPSYFTHLFSYPFTCTWSRAGAAKPRHPLPRPLFPHPIEVTYLYGCISFSSAIRSAATGVLHPRLDSWILSHSRRHENHGRIREKVRHMLKTTPWLVTFLPSVHPAL